MSKTGSKPFTLNVYYEHEIRKGSASEDVCPLVEIHFVVQPITFQINSLRCSRDEREKANSLQFKKDYEFGDRNEVVT